MGKPNVGKTLLIINFAAYLGIKEVRLDLRDGGEITGRGQRITLERARRELVSMSAPKTTMLQTLTLDPQIGRHRYTLSVIDTAGIPDEIAESPQTRRQIALTLDGTRYADVVLHVMDASAVHVHRQESPGTFDSALVDFGRLRQGYAVVMNKLDKPGGEDGYRAVKERFRGVPVLAVSALTRRGFRDLKTWVIRALP